LVELVVAMNGGAFAQSQEVGPNFEKEHRNVLQKIDGIVVDLISAAGKSAVENYFVESVYVNEKNRTYRNYLMTRDGFSLLAMSFTGKKAMEFKVKYIAAFNAMETCIKSKNQARAIGKEIRKSLTDGVKESGENERMHGYGYSNYTKFAYKTIGINYKKPKKGEPDVRDSLSTNELDRLKTVESMIKSLLEIGKEYDQIKKTITEIFGPNQKKLEGE